MREQREGDERAASSSARVRRAFVCATSGRAVGREGRRAGESCPLRAWLFGSPLEGSRAQAVRGSDRERSAYTGMEQRAVWWQVLFQDAQGRGERRDRRSGSYGGTPQVIRGCPRTRVRPFRTALAASRDAARGGGVQGQHNALHIDKRPASLIIPDLFLRVALPRKAPAPYTPGGTVWPVEARHVQPNGPRAANSSVWDVRTSSA